MSDLCSPMLLLLPNEADAFWCFQHLMARVVRDALLILRLSLLNQSFRLCNFSYIIVGPPAFSGMAWFVCLPVTVVRVKQRPNFVCTEKEVGVQKQLDNLATVVKVMDPKVHQHLGMAHRSIWRDFRWRRGSWIVWNYTEALLHRWPKLKRLWSHFSASF